MWLRADILGVTRKALSNRLTVAPITASHVQ